MILSCNVSKNIEIDIDDTPRALPSYTAFWTHYTAYSVNCYMCPPNTQLPIEYYSLVLIVTKHQGQQWNEYLSVMNIH